MVVILPTTLTTEGRRIRRNEGFNFLLLRDITAEGTDIL